MYLFHDVIPDSPLFLFLLLNVAAIPVLVVAAIVAFFRKKKKWVAFFLFSLSLLFMSVGAFSTMNEKPAVIVWFLLMGVIGGVWWKVMRGPA